MRNEFKIDSKSITSCASAPLIGVKYPSDAAHIPARISNTESNFALSLILYWRRNPDGRIFDREKYLEYSEGCRC